MESENQKSGQDKAAPIIQIMRLVIQGLTHISMKPIYALDHLFANRKSQVVNSKGLDSINPSFPILIYVHYSKSGKLANWEIASLKNARSAGVQICLVMNIEKLLLTDSFFLEPSVEEIVDVKIIRKNIGWDLSAYRDAYFLLKKNEKIQNAPILFMNNSMIWFPEMINDYFSRLLKEESDIIAGSISKQYQPHIQTYLFGSLNGLGTVQIEQWLKRIKNWRLKKTVVTHGELTTNLILRSSVSCHSFPPLELLQEKGIQKIHENFVSNTSSIPNVVIKRLLRNRTYMQIGVPVNPSHNYWLELIEHGFPGIKVDLVSRNPSRLDDYEFAIATLLKSGFDYKMINELLTSSRPMPILYKIRKYMR